MVQVQSTWFPLIDRNPQVFENIMKAKDSDFKKATERVYTSREEQKLLKGEGNGRRIVNIPGTF